MRGHDEGARPVAASGTAEAAIGENVGEPAHIHVVTRTIEVLGRPAEVFGLIQQGTGAHGLRVDPGEMIDVVLHNHSGEVTQIHWHGQEPPGPLDGNPYYAPLEPGSVSRWRYPPRTGTHWMHSHSGLQEQRLLAAPLIVRTADEAAEDRQEVVIMLHDFTFTPPDEILARLQAGGEGTDSGGHGGEHDLNDIEYDAYLANERTLDDPQVVRVEKGGRVRLRLINAATATNFLIDLGALGAWLVATDGNPCVPVRVSRFPMAIAQRADLLIDLPAGPGAWPVLARREGDAARTGIVLAAGDGAIPKLPSHGEEAVGPLGDDPFELGLRSAVPWSERHADRRIVLDLTGEMEGYVWGVETEDGGTGPIPLTQGERIEIEMRNKTDMAHPMHFHGHHFQELAISGRAFLGPTRDCVMVPASGSALVRCDCENPGQWPLHCHILYHAGAGMSIGFAY